MRARYSAPLVSFAALMSIYSLTLAPGVTLWDSGEFLAAIKTLGIPHPPGTPLFVLLAKCWSFLLAPLFGFARAVNLLSAAATAAACAIVAWLFAVWTRDNKAGICAGLVAGSMSTVWLSATETEVYALALLFGCSILWAAERSGATGDPRWALLVAYLSGLGLSLHLSALIVLPAAAVLLVTAKGGSFQRRLVRNSPDRLALRGLLFLLLGASCVLFLLIRAKHDPAVNQGNPSTFSALWDVITRRQYGEHSFFPRSAPLYVQIGNLIQYGDWQLALGLSDAPGPSFWRTGTTVSFVVLAGIGGYHHRKIDRRSWRAWSALLLVGSLGVIVYLNLKAGPSFGHGIVTTWNHEARERDYFFFFAFVAWGAWAAVGAVRLGRRLPAALAIAPFLVAAVPVVLNWRAVDRQHRPADRNARDSAASIIQLLPRSAVMLAIGDNDTYPLWYLQQVEMLRRDVTIVTLPLLSASWYRAELVRRNHLLDPGAPFHWSGQSATVDDVRNHAAFLGRPVVASPLSGAGRR